MKYIYKVSNNVNNKLYIGQTVNLEERWRTHLRLKGHCKALKAAMLKYGKDNFSIEVVAIVEDHMADDTEVKLINLYNTVSPKGYNISVGGRGVSHFLWEESYNNLLGSMSDSDVGKKIGCSSWIVRSYRTLYKIPPYNPLESLDLKLLGTMRDTDLAEISGVHKTTIKRIRDKHNIKRFSIATVVSEDDIKSKTPTEIHKETGIPVGTITSYRRRIKDSAGFIPKEV